MHIAFVDFVYHYDAGRPDTDAPLGGTTTAICFLARELVKTGVSCTFFNRAAEKSIAHGIPTLPLQSLVEEIGKGGMTAYIFCGRWSEELVSLVRTHTKAPLIAWMHESAFKEPLTPALDAFDGVVFVSEWQKRVNKKYARPHWRQAVIPNAMNPLVARSFGPQEPILAVKEKPPIFLFAGSFARGAFHIPPILDLVRQKRTDFSVEMFCNLTPSKDEKQDALYIDWLHGLPNVSHIGMVGQSELAKRMKRATFLLAPNSWPETSCIVLIEGLASGLKAITTNRAALPETASGFATEIPISMPDEQVRFDMPVNHHAFANAIIEALNTYEKQDQETESDLQKQVAYFRDNYQWSMRVSPWVSFIEELLVPLKSS
jgi:glycosyltransferase involved in cell wall biosynthesis